MLQPKDNRVAADQVKVEIPTGLSPVVGRKVEDRGMQSHGLHSGWIKNEVVFFKAPLIWNDALPGFPRIGSHTSQSLELVTIRRASFLVLI
jgi:hypothetical protein